MWRFFAAEYSYCKELVDFFRFSQVILRMVQI